LTEAGPFARVDIARSASPDGLRDLAVLSPALGRRADLTLFAPPGAEDLERLPIVILLHGVYGSHWAWARSGFAHTALTELVGQDRIEPMILAMPSDGLFGVGSGYVNRNGENAERWIVDEVSEAVRLVYPQADTTDVSIAGLSMGGWGALRLAGRYPSRFRAAVGLSPLTRLAHVAGYAPDELRAIHAPEISYPELADLLVNSRDELPPLRITCGVEDELISDVRALHAALDAAGVEHQYAEAPGGHTWDYWAEDIRIALLFINAARAGAAQAGSIKDPAQMGAPSALHL
jgi:putative tributyrin esterase